MESHDFERDFSTEKKCLEYLYHLRWEHGYRCPRCQCDKMWEVSDYKYKCKNCGYQTTVIAGTLFQDTHIPLTKWFRAMWYVSQNNRVSAHELQKELELGSNRTALTMLNKINRARIRFVLEKLQGTVEIYRTTIRLHKSITIVLAVETNHKKIGRIRLGTIENVNSEGINLFVKNCVQPQSSIISTTWNGYAKLMKQGYIQGKRISTYDFRRAKRVCSKLEQWLYTLEPTENITEYLDWYCMMFNSLKSDISFEELLNNAVHFQPQPYAPNLSKIGIIKSPAD